MARPDLSKAMEQIAKANPVLFHSLRPKWTRFIPHEPTPKQLAFLCLPHREAFYGGAVGGGKSDALLMAALQYVDVPGYAAMVFRKTLSDLKQPGALLDRTHSWLANSDAKWVAGEHTYYFPTTTLQGEPGEPAKLTFGYIGNVDAYVRYQGIELQYCVAPDTPVLMADGSQLPIGKVKVGDKVLTPEGARRVTRTHRLRGPAVKLQLPDGAFQIQSFNHRFSSSPSLTGVGSSTASCTSLAASLRKEQRYRTSLQGHGTQGQDQQRIAQEWTSYASILGLGSSYSPVGVGTCFARSGGSPLGESQLQRLYDLSVLFSPPQQRAPQYSLVGERLYALSESSGLDCLSGYSSDHRRYDGSPPLQGDLFPTSPPSPKHVEVRTQICTPVGDWLPRTQLRTPTYSCEYSHPYSSRTWKSESYLTQASLTPLVGIFDLVDITVECTSCYYTVSNPSCPVLNGNCAFDELTQHWEDDYTYMFSRLRRNKCPTHGKDVDKDCPDCSQRSQVPIRMRSASNPGNVGHAWVMERFNIGEAPDPNNPGHTRYVGRNPKRPYIPAYLQDNPFLDSEEYEHGLAELDPVTRQQLRKGDWGVSADSRFRKGWARYYSRRADNYVLGKDGRGPVHPYSSLVRVFATVDPAASAREGPGDSDIWRKAPSWTVISLWGVTTDYNLLWLDLIRFRKEIPDILDELKKAYRKWRPQYFAIEASGLGKGVFQMTAKAGLPTKAVYPHGDKLVRATDAMNRMEQGRIWLPQSAGWLDALEKELFTWTGHPQQQDDQIDTLAYAAMDVSWEAAHGEIQDHIGHLPDDMLPGVIT